MTSTTKCTAGCAWYIHWPFESPALSGVLFGAVLALTIGGLLCLTKL